MGDAIGTTTRDRTLDVIRAIATVRVVIFHTSGEPRWSWVAAMPLMFFVGGALFAGSLDRRSVREVLPQRLKRIVVPLWAWGILVAISITIAGAWAEVPWWGIPGFLVPILPAVGPRGAGNPLYLTWMALWYINAYVVFMLVGIPLRKLQQRAPRLTLALLFAPVVLSGITGNLAIGAPTAHLAFWVLGYAYHDARRRLPSTTTLSVVGVGSAVAGVAYAFATTGTNVVVTGIPFLTATIGLAWVCGLLVAGPLLRQLVEIPLLDRIVVFIQQRALTIYLWHAAAIALAAVLAERFPIVTESTILRIGVVFALTFALCLMVGWIEDLAADRPMRLWPLTRRTIDLTTSATASIDRNASVDGATEQSTDPHRRGMSPFAEVRVAPLLRDR